MRVTNSMMITNLKRDLSTNMRTMEKYQNMLASGKQIRKPSDDPVAVINTLRYSSTVMEAEKYLGKIDEAKNFLNTTDSALGNITDILQRANELTVQGLNGTNSEASRYAIAQEMRQLADQVGVIANTTYGSKHIFAGTNVTEAPFTGSSWTGNDKVMELEIGAGVKIPVNSVMGKFFYNEDEDEPGLFQLLNGLAEHLESGDTTALQKDLGLVQERLDRCNAERAIVGAKVNRLELQQNRLESTRTNYTELLAKNQDADMAEVIMELKAQENVYRASLAAGARIILPSLADFLR